MSKSNELAIKQMLNAYVKEFNTNVTGKSIRWLQNSLPWQDLNLEFESPQFRRRMSGSFDGHHSETKVNEMFKKIQSVVPLNSILQLAESSIGEPVSFELFTKHGELIRVNGNDLTLIYFSARISTFWKSAHEGPPNRILDIGGGYGGLAGKLAKIFPSAKITLIDTPEGNLLQSFYLHELFPHAEFSFKQQPQEIMKIFDAKFSIIPVRLFDLLYDVEWDLIINTRSMQEMDQEDIVSYFDLIQKKLRTGGIFYNANQLVGGSAGIPYHISRSPYDNSWALLSTNTSILQDDNFEICSLRLDFENNLFRKYLKTLPTNNIWRTGLWSYRRSVLMLVDQLGASFMPKVWWPLKKMTRFVRKKSMKKKYNGFSGWLN